MGRETLGSKASKARTMDGIRKRRAKILARQKAKKPVKKPPKK